MKKLPLGIQTLSKIITGDYIYVDKTREIFNLFSNGGQYYFLSRPRRFGKSLLVSTLVEIFSGNKELFKGLWIYDKIDWKPHPVIHIDFSGMKYGSNEELAATLNFLIDENSQKYGIQLTEDTYDKRFKELIMRLAAQAPVAVLIDEYDKPIIDYADNPVIAENNRKTLANFYSLLKPVDKYLKFALLTGVSKFSRVSVFSGLNNLLDITLSKKYSTLLGYTHDELLKYFAPYIEKLTDALNIDRNQVIAKMKQWYDGYSWDGENFVYNPYSILNLCNELSFDNYWFSSGTPSFLIKLIRRQVHGLPVLDSLPVSSYAFDSYDIENMDMAPLLFQTGYLTIKKITLKNDKKHYYLNYPNREVRDSFLTYLFQEYARQETAIGTRFLERISETVEKDDIHGLMKELKALFASIPYNHFDAEKEAYYHTVVYLVLKLCGAKVVSETPTNLGRMDAVLETAKKIYIMEFKMGDSQKALHQIKEKKYHETFLNSGKEIVFVGIGFDKEKRNIGEYVVERF